MIDYATKFWSLVDRETTPDGCWLWIGDVFFRRGKEPYGRFFFTENGRTRGIGAHRFAWRLTNGVPPDELKICHKCDTPLCCRPNHLFLGTQLDNMQDKCLKGRQTRGDQHPNRLHPENVRGERNGRAKLTIDQVHEIRRRRSEGLLLREIAASFFVSISAVRLVLSGESWRHVL